MSKVEDSIKAGGQREGLGVDTAKEAFDMKTRDSSARFNSKNQFIRERGISWKMCALFLVGDMAGGGIVAIPSAILHTGFYWGIACCCVIALISVCTSVMIGRCWTMLQSRHPEYQSHTRNVYAEIGSRAMGRFAKLLVSISLDLNQFGVSVIYLLLSAKSIYDGVTQLTGSSIHYCYIVIILAICLLPVTMLKSPEHFGWAVLGGMFCSVGSVILISIGAGLDYSTCQPHARLASFDIFRTLSALGTFVFAFGGHSSFVTIQHDMVKPYEFDKSSYLAFVLIFLIYVPMGTISNIVYGDSIHASIINSLQTVWIQQAVNIAICLHCLLTYTLVINPLNQEVEEWFGTPQAFGWKRVVVRGAVTGAVLFTGLTFPTFGPLLDLIGSSTTLLTVMIFPPIFYFYLKAAGRVREKKKLTTGASTFELEEDYPRINFTQMIQNTGIARLSVGVFIVTFGVMICIFSSISAVKDLLTTSFETPCYVGWFRPELLGNHTLPTYCCGSGYNISRPGLDLTCQHA